MFLTPLMPGTIAEIRVQASVAGCLSGWVDFNGDGTLDPLKIAAGSPRYAGQQPERYPGAGVVLRRVAGSAVGAGQHGDRGRVQPLPLHAGVRPGRRRARPGWRPAARWRTMRWRAWATSSGTTRTATASRTSAAGDAACGVTVNLLDGSGNPVLDGNGNPITDVTEPPATGNVRVPGPAGGQLQRGVRAAGRVGVDDAGRGQRHDGQRCGPGDGADAGGRAGARGGEPDGGCRAGSGDGRDDRQPGVVRRRLGRHPAGGRGRSGWRGSTLYALGADDTAYTPDDVLEQTRITDANGHYVFLPVPAGSYYVAVVSSTVPVACGTFSSAGGGGDPDLGDENVGGGDDGVPGTGPRAGEMVSGLLNARVNGQITPDRGNPLGYGDDRLVYDGRFRLLADTHGGHAAVSGRRRCRRGRRC